MLKNPVEKKFIWYGIDARGFKIKNIIFAQNIEEAKAALSGQKITLLKISRQLELSFFSSKNKIKQTDITELSVEFSTLISAGISLTAALQIMIDSARKKDMEHLLGGIKKQVENGQSLSEALKTQSHYFDNFFCNLVYAGEYSGTLEVILKHIADYREKMRILKNKIKKALFYPCIVLVVALSVTSLMLIFVIPQFAHLFESAGAQLPMLTIIVMRCADMFQDHGGTLFFMLTAAFVLLKIGVRRFTSWKRFSDRFWLKSPLLGKLLLEGILARFFYALATTLQAGLPLLDALQLTQDVVGNSVYIDGINNICRQIKNGQTLHMALKNTQIFPTRAIQMVCIGEESGHLEQMLKKLAVYFSDQVDDKVQNLTQLLEPALMIFLSVLVGTLVIAMYLPIFRLGSVL